MTAAPIPRETRWVDPRSLIARANVRAVVAPDPELVESVRVNGVIQPPVVFADGTDLVLLAGHRRTAAAIEAGLDRIEVVVGPSLDEVGRLAAQVSENTNRAALSVVEVAVAVEQLTLLGVPAGQIAQAAGLRAKQVAAARAVAEAGERVRLAIDGAPNLTLDHAAALTEWGEDPDAVASLLSAAETGPVAFAHAQARLESAREAEQKVAAAANEWSERGYQVLQPALTGSHQVPPGSVHVRDLADAEGSRFGVGYYGVSDGHAGCADRAVLLNKWRPESVEELCLNPKGNGHTKAPRGYAGTAPKDGPERSTVIENNKLWKVATGVRLSHVASTIRTGKFNADLVNALHVHLLTYPGHLDTQRGAVFGDLTDHAASGVTTTESRYGSIQRTVDPVAPAHRITGVLLAAVADAAEKSLAASTWRTPNTGAAAWLTLLVTHTGYQLSDLETQAMRLVEPSWAPPHRTAAAATAKAAVNPTQRSGRGRGTAR